MIIDGAASDRYVEEARLAGRRVRLYSLPRLAERAGVALSALPYAGRVLAEALLRDGDEEAAIILAQRLSKPADATMEMLFRPARVLLQDYTGVPLLVDLATVRDHVHAFGGDPSGVNPIVPTDLVIDHSVQVDVARAADALQRNEAAELERNHERYAFLKWASAAFTNLRVVPPGSGIVHQINLERLATVVALSTADLPTASPDTVIGTDSHTTMVNGLGVLGWGVGGLEAEAVMLGLAQPISVPRIVGVRLTGKLPAACSATDLVLTLTERLRAWGVGGALVEFCGEGVGALSASDRCTVANMAPEFGAKAAFFPVDGRTLQYLRSTGRDGLHVAFVEAYCRHQGLLREAGAADPRFVDGIAFDLCDVVPTLAGPSLPHQRVDVSSFRLASEGAGASRTGGTVVEGDIAIAAITSCTITSNPQAMLAAGLVARRAMDFGLTIAPHVKTSLAPGSHAVTRYLDAAGLLEPLRELGFGVVGYGCTTCNGGSGPLSPAVELAIERDGVGVCAVLSGNRNYAGRIHPLVRSSYLASPALVVALALRGHMRGDLHGEPVGYDRDGRPVLLADLLPDGSEIADLEARHVDAGMFSVVDTGHQGWDRIETPAGATYPWDERSTYIRRAPYLDGGRGDRTIAVDALRDARALVVLGDHVSTDHISPVGQIPFESPAGLHLRGRGIAPHALNSYGSRRGNHEVMIRGTFASPRLRNALLDGAEGGRTLWLPEAEQLTVFDAAQRYARAGTPLIVLAGRSYGSGSSRDWAAKGPRLLGVRAVIAESFEAIHRANLCAMGVLPLTFPAGEGWRSLDLDGRESFSLEGLAAIRESATVQVRACAGTGREVRFTAGVDIGTAGDWNLISCGGMLTYLAGELVPG